MEARSCRPPAALPRTVAWTVAASVVIHAGADFAHGRPIPTGPDARTERDFLKQKSAWMTRNTAGAYEKRTKDPPGQRAPAKGFIENVCRHECRQAKAPSRKALSDEARKLLDAGVRDPLVMAWCGHVLHVNRKHDEAVPVLRKALAALGRSGYPKAQAFFAARDLSCALHAGGGSRPESSRLFGVAVDTLARSVVAGEFTPAESRVAHDLLLNTGPSLPRERWMRFGEGLKGAKGIDPWLAAVVEGRSRSERMWQFRGGNVPRRFTYDEYVEYKKLVEAARDALTRAWEIDRQRPEAAAEMIDVVKAQPSKKRSEARLWFDRAVAAQMDYPSAYLSYIHFLQPGWGGSNKAMRAFGLECVATERFDTSVPRWYLYAVELSVYRMPYRSPPRLMPPSAEEVRENTHRIFGGMLADPAWAGFRDHLLMQYALNVAWYGEHRKARELLARLPAGARGEVDLRSDPSGNVFTWTAISRAVLEAEILAYTGPARELLEQADRESSGARAWPLFERAAKLHAGDKAVRLYLLERMVHARMGSRPSRFTVHRSALHHAAAEPDLKEARFLLDQGLPVDMRDRKGFTPLSMAAEKGHDSVVELLLKRGADVNARSKEGYTPLLVALNGGHGRTAALLLDRGAEARATADSGQGALHLVGRCASDKALVGRLLSLGLPLNAAAEEGLTPLHFAAESGNAAAVRAILEAGAEVDPKLDSGPTPLCLAAAKAPVEVLEILLDKGADIEAPGKGGKRPLHCAAERRTPDAVRLLLDRRAGVEAKDSIGMTALMHAAKSGSAGTVRLLLGRGAQVNARERDRATALTYASRRGSAETVRLLLDAGAGIGAVDKYRYTPLHHAASSGHPQVVKILLEKGADPFATATRGRTVLDVAKERRRNPRLARSMSAVIDVLEKHIEKLKTPPPEDDVF